MSLSYSKSLKEYALRISDELQQSNFDQLERVAEILMEARKNGKWIFLAGNGGSASTASHFANDMVKGLSIGEKARFKAKALCDALPIMTALANDYDYSLVFQEQLKNFASEGDVLIAISGSGNSPNVVKAAQYAKEKGMTVISFGGRDGGKMKEYSDVCCIAKSDCMEEIEDIHLIWEHSLVFTLRNVIEAEA